MGNIRTLRTGPKSYLLLNPRHGAQCSLNKGLLSSGSGGEKQDLNVLKINNEKLMLLNSSKEGQSEAEGYEYLRVKYNSIEYSVSEEISSDAVRGNLKETKVWLGYEAKTHSMRAE